MKYETIYLFVVLFLSVSLNLQAENYHDNHEAHVHGLASLTLAIENNQIEMELNSPAINLIGFEHRASSSEEEKSVEKIEVLLESTKTLFSFKGSKCEISDVMVDVSSVMSKEHKHQEHDHHHAESTAENHSEIVAKYNFSCDNSNDLFAVSVDLFKHFSLLENINAMWVTETRQGSEILSKEKNTIKLR